MKRSSRFKPVVKVEQNRERTAARHFGQCQQTLSAHQKKLDELISYRAEYQERYVTSMKQGTDGTTIQEYRAFLHKLDRAIAQQEQLIVQSEGEVSSSRQHWMQKRTRTRAIDTLVDKIKADEKRQVDRKEQKDSDERALQSRRMNHLKYF
jgi:flagellar FliJ protein